MPTTSPPSVLSTALIKMSLTDPDSPRRTSQADNHHANIVETIANCPQAIKDLSAASMPALVSNLQEIAARNRSLLRNHEQRERNANRSVTNSNSDGTLTNVWGSGNRQSKIQLRGQIRMDPGNEANTMDPGNEANGLRPGNEAGTFGFWLPNQQT